MQERFSSKQNCPFVIFDAPDAVQCDLFGFESGRSGSMRKNATSSWKVRCSEAECPTISGQVMGSDPNQTFKHINMIVEAQR